jgi:hypothetical protein
MTGDERARQADEIVTLRASGMKCRQIAERVGCNEYRVWYVLRSRGVAPPRDRAQRLLVEVFGGAEGPRA